MNLSSTNVRVDTIWYPIRQISRLRGGQRQRIAIARVLISRAQILICDEITASLDAETEKTVLSTLFRAMKGKTLLLQLSSLF
mmetsp:Transcript_15468/g.23381  ORF Transcript_15468/g.23381 Transcript_15468/m.23381 type:complete len:83 (-) Transcript_15468:190-438(-)